MTIPPKKEEVGEDNLKKIYQEIREKFDFLKKEFKLQDLSAGMSNDYSIAVQSGSNMIRVGRKLFFEKI